MRERDGVQSVRSGAGEWGMGSGVFEHEAELAALTPLTYITP